MNHTSLEIFHTKSTTTFFPRAFAYRVNDRCEGIIPNDSLFSNLATADCVVPIRSATSCWVIPAFSRALKIFLRLTYSASAPSNSFLNSRSFSCSPRTRSKGLTLVIKELLIKEEHFCIFSISIMKLKLLLTAILVPFILTGCGAPKPPQPHGAKISVAEFAQQRVQKNQEKLLKEKAEKSQTNIRFGYETE